MLSLSRGAAIVENTSGRSTFRLSLAASGKSFWHSVTLRNNFAFFRGIAFRYTYGLYGATYLAANLVDTACEWRSVPARIPKLLGVTPVNMTLVICKDVVFGRAFGAAASASPPPAGVVPKIPTPPEPAHLASSPAPRVSWLPPVRVLALFAVRDLHTISASFVLPPLASKWLVDNDVASRGVADVASQLLCPALAQLPATPYQLLALDMMNRPTVGMADRGALILQKYTATVMARVGRVLPAFGVGGVSNRAAREDLIARYCLPASELAVAPRLGFSRDR